MNRMTILTDFSAHCVEPFAQSLSFSKISLCVSTDAILEAEGPDTKGRGSH